MHTATRSGGSDDGRVTPVAGAGAVEEEAGWAGVPGDGAADGALWLALDDWLAG